MKRRKKITRKVFSQIKDEQEVSDTRARKAAVEQSDVGNSGESKER